MDELTAYETSDVLAGVARFPSRPTRKRRGCATLDAGTRVCEHADHFAQHAWDESGRL